MPIPQAAHYMNCPLPVFYSTFKFREQPDKYRNQESIIHNQHGKEGNNTLFVRQISYELL